MLLKDIRQNTTHTLAYMRIVIHIVNLQNTNKKVNSFTTKIIQIQNNICFNLLCFRNALKLIHKRDKATDGLNSIAPYYHIIRTEQRPLYTWMLCDVYAKKKSKVRTRKRRKKKKGSFTSRPLVTHSNVSYVM